MVKTITIDGIEVALKSSGATYIKYREIFHDDLFIRFQGFAKGGDTMPDGAIETLTRAAYVMALQANPEEDKSFEEWCDQFSFTGLAEGLKQVSQLLTRDRKTISSPKKKKDQPSE